MAFEKKVALAGSHKEMLEGASVARAIDKNEIVSVTVVLRRRTPSAAAESFAFSDQQLAFSS